MTAVTTATFASPGYADADAAAVPTYVVATFSSTGTLVTFTGAGRFYVPNACTLDSVRASVGTAPTGAAVICDVKANGTSIFTVGANKPTITATTFTDLAGAASITSLALGDYLTVDLNQVGSTIAGADLTVQVYLLAT